MVTFLEPVLLWAAAVAVAPLVLHLLRRRRLVTVPFSTVRFFQAARRRSSRRLRLENLLLWLARTLLILALVLTFALPVLRSTRLGALAGHSERDVAIVLDVSYSMGYEAGGRRVWDEAQAAAAAVLRSLQPGDRVCLFLADADAVPLLEQPTADAPLAGRILAEQRVGFRGSRLLPALQAACRALGNTPGREREVMIITDGQAHPWREVAGNPDLARARSVAGIAFFALLAGPEAPRNATPVRLQLEPRVLLAGAPGEVRVEVQRCGPIEDATVFVRVDGREVARRALSFVGDLPEGQSIPLPPLAAGTHALTVETAADGVAVDNAFHWLLRCPESLTVVCVGSAADTFFLERALSPGAATPGLRVRRVAPAEFGATDLTGVVCVFLCNALPLDGQAILRLEAYIDGGGVACFFPGDRAGAADYAALRCLPLAEAGLAVGPYPAAGPQALYARDAESVRFPSLAGCFGEGAAVVASRSLQGSVRPEASVLVTAGGAPFVTARPVGRGYALLCAVSAGRDWSNLPLSPGFAPFVHALVEDASGFAAQAPFVWGTARLPVPVAVGPDRAAAAVQTPGGELRTPHVVSEAEGGPATAVLENAFEPGFYRLGPGPTAVPFAAVNLPRLESDLTPLPPAALAELAAGLGLITAVDRDEWLRLEEQKRLGRPLAEPLLWCVVLLAVLEFALANRAARPGTVVTERLAIDPEGRVRTASGPGGP